MNEPDRSLVEAQRRKLDTQSMNGGIKAEGLYREAFLAWKAEYNDTPGLPKLTNR